MTPAQLDVANRNMEGYTRDVCKFSKPNMKFIYGEIEYLDKAGIPDQSQDIVISNCVVRGCCCCYSCTLTLAPACA